MYLSMKLTVTRFVSLMDGLTWTWPSTSRYILSTHCQTEFLAVNFSRDAASSSDLFLFENLNYSKIFEFVEIIFIFKKCLKNLVKGC